MAVERRLSVLLCFVITLIFHEVKSDNLLCNEQFCKAYRVDPGCRDVSPHCTFNNITHNGVMVPSPTFCNCCDMCFVYLNEDEECSLGGLGGAVLLTSRCGPGLSCQRLHDDSSTCRRMVSDCYKEIDAWHDKRQAGKLGIMETVPRCDDAGRYAPNKCISGKTCFCQNKDGKRIFGEALYLNSLIETRMACSCARLHDEMSWRISGVTRWPAIGAKCLPDGNYNPIQCIGDICFCVDILTGKATERKGAINMTNYHLGDLDCFDPTIHRNNFTFKTFCEEERDDRIAELQYYEEEGYSISLSDIQTCEPDGTYARMKTVRDRVICVDADGEQIEDYGADFHTENHKSMNCKCARTVNLISQATINAPFERPSCCSNGNYRPVQCRQSACYCVNEDGIQVGQEVDNVHVSNLPCYTERWRQC